MDNFDRLQEMEETELVQAKYSPDVSLTQAINNSRFTKRFADEAADPEFVAMIMEQTRSEVSPCRRRDA